jgi:hypothetical protein
MFMELTDRQIKELEMINSHREQQPTFGSLLRKNIRPLILNTIIYVTLASLFIMANWTGLGFIMIGYLIGVLSRDIRAIKIAVSNWELNHKITSWDGVDDLLNREKQTT